METTKIPENAFTANHPIEFYKLSERKRVFYIDNIEKRIGLEYYIYSEESQGWYKRNLTERLNPFEDIVQDILLGYIKIVYTDDDTEQLKRVIERDKLTGYISLLRRSIGECNQSTANGKLQDTGWFTKDSIYQGYRNV